MKIIDAKIKGLILLLRHMQSIMVIAGFLASSSVIAGMDTHLPVPGSTAIDPAEIVQLIKSTAAEGNGITGEEQELAHRVQELGSPAIPYLLPLLEHENEDVRALTSYILRSIDGLTEEHFEALKTSRLKGDGWIPPAIARIGTPEAISFLVEELKKEKQDHTQLTHAIKSLGGKAVPDLIELYRMEDTDEELLYTVNFIFDEMGDEANRAVDPLTEIALDDNIAEYVRRMAIFGLGSIGETARRSVEALLDLADKDPESFETAVAGALWGMKAPEAVSYLLRDLNEYPNIISFRDIAELGEDGVSAGPELIQYLNHENWRVRIGAARTLGFVGYKGASQPLIGVLDNVDDWRLVYVAAESLGRLQSQESIHALARLEQEHWYPPIREAAGKALEVIRGKSGYELKYHPDNFPFEFFDYESVRLDKNVEMRNGAVEYPDDSFIIPKNALSPSRLVDCSYIAYMNVPNAKGHKQIPDVGIRVEDGCLVGSARGEWGGELMFIDTGGKSTLILKDNIRGIYRTPEGIFVVAGLAHLTSNRGIVYKVSKDDTGSWNAPSWKALPGAPRSSALTKEGSLYIECVGGNILLTPDGAIKMANLKGME